MPKCSDNDCLMYWCMKCLCEDNNNGNDNKKCCNSPLTFNWSNNSEDGYIDSLEWNDGGNPTVTENEQTYNIFSSENTNTVTVEGIFGVEPKAETTRIVIDEILPVDFNKPNITGPMVLGLTSVEGNIDSTVIQTDPRELRFTGTINRYEIVKVTFTVTPTANCSIWNYRAANVSGGAAIFLYNVKITV